MTPQCFFLNFYPRYLGAPFCSGDGGGGGGQKFFVGRGVFFLVYGPPNPWQGSWVPTPGTPSRPPPPRPPERTSWRVGCLVAPQIFSKSDFF